MSAPFEDGPPLVRPRVCRDVIDWGNQTCAEKRSEQLRKEFAAQLPYQVHYGTMQCHTQHFASFDKALEFTIDHVDDEFQPALLGAGHDGERDGLSVDERDVVAEAYQLRTARRAY